MAKISQYPAAVTIQDTDQFIIARASTGDNFSVTLQSLREKGFANTESGTRSYILAIDSTGKVVKFLETSLRDNLYQNTILTDGATVNWDTQSKVVSTALLDTVRTAVTLSITNIGEGTYHSLFVRKQSASDLEITCSSQVYKVGNTAAANTITLSGQANQLFKIEFNKVQGSVSIAANVEMQGSGSASIADGDKGDISISAGVWTIDNNAVTDAKIQSVSWSKITSVPNLVYSDQSYANPAWITSLDWSKIINKSHTHLISEVTGLQTALDSKEATITAGTATQYWRGDKTWQTLNTTAVSEGTNLYYTDARVRAAVLTGYTVGTNAALAATDSILSAFGKVQAQINAKESSITAGTTSQYWRGDKSWQTFNLQNLTSVGNTTNQGIVLTNTAGTKSVTVSLDTNGNVLFNAGTDQNFHFSGDVVAFSSMTPPSGSWWTSMPIASATTLGGIKIGNNLSIDANGVLSATGGGTGSVSSVGLSLPAIFTVTGSPVTSAGTLTATLATQSANVVFAGPTTGTASPTFRALVSSDIPALSYEPVITSGTTAQYWRGDKSWQTLNTTAVAEGTNLYYTDTRVRAAVLTGYVVGTNTALAATDTVLGAFQKVQGQINAKESTITAGTTAQYWRGDKSWQTLNTAAVTESTNLYYTDARARAAISLTTTGSSGASTYSSSTGVLNVPTYTLAGLGGEAAITSGTTSQYWRGDKSWQTFNLQNLTTVGNSTNQGIVLNNTAGTKSVTVSVDTNGNIIFNAGTDQNFHFSGDVVAFSALTPPAGSWWSSMPIATATTLGGIKVGANLTIDANGVLSATGGGSGSVTSVGLSLPAIFTVTGSPVTSTGTLTATLATQSAGSVFAGPTTGVNASPTFRTLVASDIPSLSYEPVITAGTTAQYWRGDKSWQTLNTTAVAEGTNLYYTDARVRAAVLTGYAVGTNTALAATDSVLSAFQKVQGQINAREATITAGTTAQYWRGDKSWQTLNTTAVAEGTNLYYTDVRARAAISLTTTGSSGSAAYSSATGVLNVPTYTISGLGGVATTRTLTINGTAQDLSLDRTWSVGTVTSVTVSPGTGLSGGGTVTSSGTATLNIAATYSPQTATELDNLTSLDSLVSGGFYYQTANADTTGNNYPTNLAGSLIVQKSAGNATQLYITYPESGNDMYFRSKYLTAFGSWNKVWHNNNQGSSSGLDADLLDGQHGSYYQTAITAGTTSQYWRGDKTWQTFNLQNLTTVGNSTNQGIVLNNTAGTKSVTVSLDTNGNILFSAGTDQNFHFSGDVVAFSSMTPPATSWWSSLPIASATTLGGIKVGTNLSIDVNGVLSASGGSGSVTSVGLSLPAIFTVTGSPVTTSGTLTATLATQSANVVFAGPTTGVAAAPTFRSLVAADIPALSYEPVITAGTTAQYWRGDKSWQTLNTTAVTEGTNLYYTDTRVRAAVLTGYVVGTNTALAATDTVLGAFQKVQGQISAREATITAGTTAQYWRGDKSWQTLNTAAVTESTNLYYTDARVLAAALTGYAVGTNTALAATDTVLGAFQKVQGQINAREATITAGTTAQYWRGDKSWQTLNTAAVTESTNLYYTDARARASITLTVTGSSGASTYSSATGALNIPTYTLAGLGGQASSTNLTSLSGLTYASVSFVKMSAANTFSLDTTTYTPTARTTSVGTTTLTPDVSTGDVFTVSGLTGTLTIQNPTGSPYNGQKIIIRIKDNGTAKTITWPTTGSVYRASSDLSLPITTTASKTIYLGFVYNSTDTKWDLLAKLDNFA